MFCLVGVYVSENLFSKQMLKSMPRMVLASSPPVITHHHLMLCHSRICMNNARINQRKRMCSCSVFMYSTEYRIIENLSRPSQFGCVVVDPAVHCSDVDVQHIIALLTSHLFSISSERANNVGRHCLSDVCQPLTRTQTESTIWFVEQNSYRNTNHLGEMEFG